MQQSQGRDLSFVPDGIVPVSTLKSGTPTVWCTNLDMGCVWRFAVLPLLALPINFYFPIPTIHVFNCELQTDSEDSLSHIGQTHTTAMTPD